MRKCGRAQLNKLSAFRAAEIILCLVLLCSAQSTEKEKGATNSDAIRSDPVAYLNRALDEIQKHALRRNTVDWKAVRALALQKAANVQLTVDA
jgi:hypothetical protein